MLQPSQAWSFSLDLDFPLRYLYLWINLIIPLDQGTRRVDVRRTWCPELPLGGQHGICCSAGGFDPFGCKGSTAKCLGWHSGEAPPVEDCPIGTSGVRRDRYWKSSQNGEPSLWNTDITWWYKIYKHVVGKEFSFQWPHEYRGDFSELFAREKEIRKSQFHVLFTNSHRDCGSRTSQLRHCRQLIVGKEAGNAGWLGGWVIAKVKELGYSPGHHYNVFTIWTKATCSEDHTPHCSTPSSSEVSSPFACNWCVVNGYQLQWIEDLPFQALPGTSSRGKHLIIILVLRLRFLRMKVIPAGIPMRCGDTCELFIVKMRVILYASKWSSRGVYSMRLGCTFWSILSRLSRIKSLWILCLDQMGRSHPLGVKTVLLHGSKNQII